MLQQDALAIQIFVGFEVEQSRNAVATKLHRRFGGAPVGLSKTVG